MAIRILLPVLLILLPQEISSFASWLKCYVDLDDSEIIMNYPVLLPEHAPHPGVRLSAKSLGSEEWSQDSIVVNANDEYFDIRLEIPDALKGQDLQFVIETSDGAVFPNPPEMCEGRRTHANYAHQQSVALKVTDKSKSEIKVWAGWATGHDVVSLTYPFYLRTNGESGEL